MGVHGIPPFGRMPTLSYHHCINTQLTASSCWYALITQVSSPAFVALTLKWSRTVPSNWMTTCPTYRWRETGSVFISHAFDPYRLCTFIQSFCCFDGIIDLLNCISQTFISYIMNTLPCLVKCLPMTIKASIKQLSNLSPN